MAAVVVVFDGDDSVQWRSMVLAMDYDKEMARQRWPAQRKDERVAQGEATQQLAGVMRGQESGTKREQ
jgi:hypothetical protein